MKTNFQFPYATVVILLTLTTHQLLSMYGYVHWSLLPLTTENIELAHLESRVDQTDKILADTIDSLRQKNENSKEAIRYLFAQTGNYSRTGILALIISIVAVFRRKGPQRFISLPFGLYSGYLALTIM